MFACEEKEGRFLVDMFGIFIVFSFLPFFLGGTGSARAAFRGSYDNRINAVCKDCGNE